MVQRKTVLVILKSHPLHIKDRPLLIKDHPLLVKGHIRLEDRLAGPDLREKGQIHLAVKGHRDLPEEEGHLISLVLQGDNHPVIRGHPLLVKDRSPLVKGHHLLAKDHLPLTRGCPRLVKGHPPLVRGRPLLVGGHPLHIKDHPLLVGGHPEGLLEEDHLVGDQDHLVVGGHQLLEIALIRLQEEGHLIIVIETIQDHHPIVGGHLDRHGDEVTPLLVQDIEGMRSLLHQMKIRKRNRIMKSK